MIRRFQLFLGPTRVRALILLLGITGLISLMLNAIVNQYDWVRPVQSLLVLVFLGGAAVIIGGRMERGERSRWIAILTPSLGALALGIVLPHLMLPLAGAALGWIVAGLFLFRDRMRVEYQKAIKHLRKSRYAEAVKVMDEVINAEPNDPNHYRFRAEILRLWGKLGPARRDYKKMTEIAPDSAVAYNGLAEVCLQAGDYVPAREAALKAYELAPGEWVAAYNLGMIEDRMMRAAEAVEHLHKALDLKVPDARHRLLIHFYLARAHSRLGEMSSAQSEVEALKKHKNGLEEWQTILEAEQAATLRAVLEEDIQTAQALVDGKCDVTQLASEGSS